MNTMNTEDLQKLVQKYRENIDLCTETANAIASLGGSGYSIFYDGKAEGFREAANMLEEVLDKLSSDS